MVKQMAGDDVPGASGRNQNLMEVACVALLEIIGNAKNLCGLLKQSEHQILDP